MRSQLQVPARIEHRREVKISAMNRNFSSGRGNQGRVMVSFILKGEGSIGTKRALPVGTGHWFLCTTLCGRCHFPGRRPGCARDKACCMRLFRGSAWGKHPSFSGRPQDLRESWLPRGGLWVSLGANVSAHAHTHTQCALREFIVSRASINFHVEPLFQELLTILY